MNIERLFGIVYYILNHKKATTAELSNLFEVSVRTINRDINKLSSIGIPIYTEVGRNGGVYLLDNFVLDKVLLSEEEKRAILLALKSISSVDPNLFKSPYTKIQSLFQEKIDNWLEIDFSSWYQSTESDSKFEQLKNSISNNRQIEFTYMGVKSPTQKRKCHPYKLIYKSQSWYLHAFCTERRDFRYFKINRMHSIKVLNASFTVRDTAKTPIINFNGKTISMQLEFSKEVFYRVYDEFDYQDIIKENNQSVIIETIFPETDWLISYLLSFGRYLKILNPESIREKVRKEIALIHENTWVEEDFK
ncbi:helix-turn-helix transcriptional regulator [Enterococcus faecalis]|uniref:helix-turn-helix transcriptional regulator n=1 Tax=Enterococcus faecalis TaxID=1351 RepID=UPI002DB6A058|nr:YafY family protein [Enterococcus faecalis]MEB7792168.1 YafY family transcriptional regulator [Enterococcus faecalis]MEB7810188.1 YafY family transcriptional regulator [Enterococcus faecalis]